MARTGSSSTVGKTTDRRSTCPDMGSTDVSCTNAKMCKEVAGNGRSSLDGDVYGYVRPYRVEIDRLASFSMSQLDGLSDVMCGYCPQLSRAFKLLGKGIDLCSRAGGERKRRENPKEEEEEERECKIPLYNLDSESNLDMRSILNPLKSHNSLFMRPGSCPVWLGPVLSLEPMPFGIVASSDAS